MEDTFRCSKRADQLADPNKWLTGATVSRLVAMATSCS